MKILITALATIATLVITTTAQAFCGFYVARADTSLFNKASQVVLVRDSVQSEPTELFIKIH